MKLYEIKAFFPNGTIEDYATKANNFNAAIKGLYGKFGHLWPTDWKATVAFQAYRVRQGNMKSKSSIGLEDSIELRLWRFRAILGHENALEQAESFVNEIINLVDENQAS